MHLTIILSTGTAFECNEKIKSKGDGDGEREKEKEKNE
jgi:hypothetical protein